MSTWENLSRTSVEPGAIGLQRAGRAGNARASAPHEPVFGVRPRTFSPAAHLQSHPLELLHSTPRSPGPALRRRDEAPEIRQTRRRYSVPGRPGPSLRRRPVSVEQTGRLHVAAEVGRVDRLAADRLVEPLRLAQRELLREQPAADAHEPRLVGDPGAQAPEAVVDDPRVVERELGQRVERVPARVALGRGALRQRLRARRARGTRSRAASRAGRGRAPRTCAAARGAPSRRRSSRAACAPRSAPATPPRRRSRRAGRTCRAGAPRAGARAGPTARRRAA